MKFKSKILIISLVVIVALTLGVVSAADNASDVQTTLEQNTSAVSGDAVDDDFVGVDNQKEILSEERQFNGDTFTGLQSQINNARSGDTIVLNKDILQDGNSQILINKTLTINGNGHVIDAAGKSRIFFISADNVVLKNIVFINGNPVDDKSTWDRGDNTIYGACGGAIKWNGDKGTIEDCYFINNTVTPKNNTAQSYGGTIFWNSSNAKLINCNFMDNFGVYRGGVVYLFGQNFTVSHCNFLNNTPLNLSSSNGGGALEAIGMANITGFKLSSGVNCTVLNCTFKNNYGGWNTLAMWGGYEYVYDCTFINNTGLWGGAIYLDANKYIYPTEDDPGYGPGVVCNCTFINNTSPNVSEDGWGGGINVQAPNSLIKDCIFINNSGYNAGALNLGASARNTTVDNCTFINNNGHVGGALRAVSTSSSTIKNCVFTNNTNYEIYLWKFEFYLENNTISNSINNNGGIIKSQVKITVLNNSTVYGKIKRVTRLTLKITDDNNNPISSTGVNFFINGAAKAATRDSKTGEMYLNYTTTFADTYPVSATSTKFTNYTVYRGTLVVENSGDFTILKNLIDGATAGTVINLTRDYIYTEGMDTMVTGIAINKNLTINGNGHIIDAAGKSRIFNITSDNVVLNDIVFKNAYARVAGGSTSGGAIYCNGSYIDLNGCVFENNEVTYNLTGANMGGAVHFEGSSYVNICDCYFLNNTAAARGAISTTNCNYFTITNTDFVNNTALTTWNGVIGLSGNNFIFRNCLFENNKATTGGGVGSFNGDNHIIDNCTFKNNSATDAGCMNWVGHNGIISNSWFIENTAGYHGILCARNVNGTIYNCTFIKNTDSAKAGAININADNVTVSKCRFEENTAKNGGGAIFIGNFFTSSGNAYPIIISDCSFRDNGDYEIILDTPANCSFKNNKLSKFILLTRGNITSKTNIIVLNNATLNVNKGDNVNLTAVVSDDNNNVIIGGDLKFVVETLTVDAVCNNNGVWWANHVFNEYGDYPLSVNYDTSSLVNAIVLKAFITTKLNITIDLSKLVNLTVGNATADIKVPENATGSITITVDSVDYVSPINNGIASFNLSSITAGLHNACVKYSGDNVYLPCTINTTITIDKRITPPEDINITDLGNTTAGNATLVVNVPENVTGNITVTIDGENYTAPIVNGTAVVNLTNATPGTHEATVTYGGDDNNDPVTKNITVTIAKAKLNLQVTVTEGNDTTPTVISVSVPGDFDGKITVKVNNNVYEVPVTQGTGSVCVNLTYGDYTAEFNAFNSTKYNDTTLTKNINILDTRTPLNPNSTFVIPSNGTVPSNGSFVVDVPKNLTGNITVNIGGNNYTSPINNGTATFDLSKVEPGKYKVIIIYSGDKNYKSTNTTMNMTVPEPVITLVDNRDISVLYSGKATYTIHVLADGKNIKDGENVTIIFNGVKNIVKTVNGTVSLVLKTALKVGKYTVSVQYKNKTASNIVTIKNIINAKKLKKLKKSKKVNKVKVSLAKVNGKYLKGKKLTLKIKGKKVATAKTNKKGVATFKVKKKKLKKFKKGKKYKATVTYGKDVVTKKIKIVK